MLAKRKKNLQLIGVCSVNSRLKAYYIIGQRNAFHRQRTPGSSARKETVYIDILITFLDVTRMSVSTVFFLAQLDPGILCLYVFLRPII